ncbi:helix-turn-helix domain-containing protein [Massilia yuzhufengensis]|uniref:Transcriptional regulator, XRE family with cupin sensor n=1 Tax=Massilia yuzhufengensis TaxID=1164594 RepID=A0A1I1VBA1_9BURK|nr:helix-turn-helix domain-containing protein [Massilia yuzhufengensis]SFD80169.1 transcriptional regulator, XRE family with cupin sensor [Massilia yuzhufengensis]
MDINDRIAARVKALRKEHGFSLDELAARSSVSRSTISLVERGEGNATAVVLEKLATGLGLPLAALFDDPGPRASPLSRRADQVVWRDPASGYLRRNVSPAPSVTPLRIVEVELPPGARIAYDTAQHLPAIRQQVWVLDGAIELAVGSQAWALAQGDCLAFDLDQPVAYANPHAAAARYAVVILSTA